MIDIFDIEADGLKPTKIHCLSVMKNGKLFSTTDYDKMRAFFENAKIVGGHNIYRYDIPNIERLLGIKVKCKLVDTLPLSWYLEPTRKRHGLAEWGEEFGVPKPKVDDWENLAAEEYIHRCEEDVKINSKLWDRQWKQLFKLYDGDPDKVWKFIDYIMFKMDCAAEQERSRWKLDVVHCKTSLKKLEKLKEEKVEELRLAMPPVPVMATKQKPKKMYLKNKPNTLSEQGKAWVALLEEQGLPEDHEGVVEYIKDWKEPNPGSHEQIKSWLYSFGWVPETFAYKRNKETGEVKKIEQVQQDKTLGPGLCSSVKKLYVKEPRLEILDGLSILTHRISVLNGFLNNVDDEGYVQAKVQGLTNTLRFKHEVVVNLPGVDKPYGADIRGCLVAPEGYELVGSDMSSLEDRCKQHYMWPYDPEYVKEMIKPDFDPHLDLAVFAGALSAHEVELYKAGFLKKEEEGLVKAMRKIYKSVNYACVYGAGGPRVAITAGVSTNEGYKLVDAYWQRNWSVKRIAEDQRVKVCNGMKWLYNPVSGFWYSLRHEKDRFSTLNQGTGVYCFDVWIGNFRKKRPQLTGQMHDEVILCVKKGHRKQAEKLLRDAIEETNKQLKLNRELDISVQFGDRYSDIH
ncbi:putative DNA polymerase [Pseudomonas phage O4]|uniref:putative DNA polymerase n=1 Tax=Pseudomonas phage O4 TaxID=1784982 RepID=UPI00078E64FB|nr:putative DNA polymerase [Pseudomonas phage O4]AMO43517.1 putative DNA polymerase [Pseudomonas phage O4]